MSEQLSGKSVLYAPDLVNKVKSAFSGGASKLEGITGVFNKHRGGNDLQRLSNAAEAERQASIRARGESTIDRIHIVVHGTALFFTFLAICLTGAVAGFQAKWVGVSGGTGFVLFLLLLSFILSCVLLAIPIAYDRWDRCRRPAQFLSQPRAAVILNIFGGFLMIVAAIISSAAGFGAHCKNAGASTKGKDDSSSSDSTTQNARRADGTDSTATTTEGTTSSSSETKDMSGFIAGFAGWCRTRQAAAMFTWFAFLCWLGLAVLAGLAFRRERQSARRRENAFIPPEDGETGPYGDGVVDDVFADKHEAPAVTQPLVSEPQEMSPTRPLRTGYGRVQADSAMARPSVDAYGAFDGDMPGSDRREQPSRTMQMAYADPYDQIRKNVLNDGASYSQTPPPPQLPQYGVQQPPVAPPAPYSQPPSYGGY